MIDTLAAMIERLFDRLLIAQAIIENVSILSVDAIFDNYAVSRLW